ncbi:MAG: GNAT family N-acetyltransferase [Candidatus Thermoplasmatota archaeon]|nr:GNAT family N-acetyltransferase [Candidatus Thermoplasmatota archaeon]
MKHYKLQGRTVTLSNDLKASYAEAIAELANDPVISRNIGGHGFHYPYTIEDAINFFTMNREDGKKFFAIDFIIFFDGTPAGIIGLKDIDYVDRKCHVGYWIGRKFWSRGIASESLGLVTRFAADEISMHRLYTGVLDFNAASMKVLLKNGYYIEGVERDTYFMEGRYFSMIRFARIVE